MAKGREEKVAKKKLWDSIVAKGKEEEIASLFHELCPWQIWSVQNNPNDFAQCDQKANCHMAISGGLVQMENFMAKFNTRFQILTL